MDGSIDGYTALDGHTLAGHFDTLKMYLNVGFPYQVQIADVERLAANDIRFVPEVPLPLDMFQLNGIYSNDDKCLMNAGATGLREPQFLGPTYDVRLDTWSELSERYLYYGLRHQMHNGRFPTPAEYYSHEYTLFRNWRHPNPNLLFAPDTDVVLQKLRLAKVYQESRDRYYSHPLLLFCSRTERSMNDHMLEDYDDDLFILHFQGCHVFGFHKFVIRWSDEEQSPVRYIVNIFTGTLYTADPFKGAAGWSVEQRQMYIYETALTVHICETIITNSAGGVPRQVLPILYPRRMAIEYEEESCASSNASGVSERSDRSQEQMEEEEKNEEPHEERMETEEQPSQEAKADERGMSKVEKESIRHSKLVNELIQQKNIQPIDTYRVNGKDRLVFDEASLMAAGRFDAGHYDSYRVQPQSMNENPLPDNFLEDSPPKNSSNNRGSPTNLETQLRDTSIKDRDHNRNEKQQHQTNGNNDTGNGSNKNTSEHLEDNANKNAVEEPKEQPQEAKATFAAPSNKIDWSILYAKRKPGAKVPASSPLGFLANKNSQAPLGFLANKSRQASLAFLANRNRQPASEAGPVATVPPVEQLQKPTVNPLEQQQSPAVNPLEQQQSPAVSPLEQQQSPAVSPAAQMKSPAISSEEQQQSLAVDPMEQQKSRAISPLEQQKSPAVNPAEQLKNPAISSLAPLKGPAIRPAEQLESSAIHPLEEQKSPAVSPLEETTKSVVSPLELPKTVVSPVEQSTKPAVSPLQQRKAPSADPFAQLKSQSTKTVQEQKPPATSAKLQTMMQRRAAERPKLMSVFDAMLKRKKETAAAAPAAPIAQPVRKQNLASLFAKPAEKKDPVSTVAPTWALGMKVTTNKTKKKDEPVEKKVPIVESHSARGFIGFHFRKPGEESPISSRSASPARAKRSNESPMQAYVRTSRIDQTPVASQPTSRDQSPVVPPTPAPSRESSYESVRSSTRSSQLSSGSDSSSTTSSDRSSSISASQISQRMIPSPVPPKALILSPFEALRTGGQLLKPQIPPPQPEPIVASSTPSSETPGGSTQVPAAQPASDEKVQEPNLASLSLQEPVEEPAKILENTMNGLSLRSVYQGPSGEEDNQPVPSYNHNDQPESSVVDETYPLEEFMEPPGPSGQHNEHQSSSGRPMEQVNSTLKNDDQPRPSADYSEPTRPQPLPPVHRPSQQTVPLKKQTVRIVYSPLPKVSTTQAAVSSPSPPAADTSKTAKPNETLEAYRKRTQMKAKEQGLSVAPSPSSPAVIVRSATNDRIPIYVPARSDQPIYYLMQKPNLPVPVVTRNPARPGARGGRAAPRPAAGKIQAMEGNEPPTTTSPAIRYVSVFASSLTTDAPVLDSHIWDKQVNNEKEVNREPSAVSFPTQNGQLDPNNEQISPGGASTLQQKKKSVPRKAATQKTRQPRKTRAKKSTPPPLEETEEREASTPYEYQPMPETHETEDSSDQSDAPVYRRWLREWPYDEHNYAELDDGINSKNVKMPPGRNKLAVVLEGIKLEKQPEEEQPRVDNPDVPSTSAERPRSPTPVPAGPKRGRPHKGQEIQWTPAVAPNEPKRNPRTRTRNNPGAPPVDTVGVTHERKPKTKKIPIKIEPIEEEPIEKEPIEEEAGCSKEIEKEPEPEEEEKPAPEKRGRGRPKKVVRPRGRKGALMRKIATALEHAYYRTHKKKVPPELERIPEEEMADLLRQADEYKITRGEFTVLTRPVPIEPEEIPKIKPKACKLPGLINLLRKLVANSSLLEQELTQEVLDQLVDVVSSQKLSEVQHRIQELMNQQDELKKKEQAALLAVKDLLEPMINELESFDLAPLPYHDKGSEIEDEETFEEIPSCSESAIKAMNEINNMILPQLMANAVLVRTATLDETQTSRLSELFTDVMDNKKMNVLEEGAQDVNNIVSQDKRDLFNEMSTTLTDDEETTHLVLEDLPLKVDAPSSHESESIADYLESNVSNHAAKAVPHAEEGVYDVSEENYADNEVSKAVDSCILNEEEAEPATYANAPICSGEGNEREEYKQDEVRDIPSAIEKSAHIDSNLPLELLQPVCEAEQSSYVAQEKLDEDILDYSSEPSARYESDANESVSAASEPELEETSIESEQAPCQEDIVESKSLDVCALDDEVTEAEVLKPVEKHITNGPASAEEEYYEMVDDHSGLEDLVCAGENNERDDQDKAVMRNIPSTIETAPTESVIPVELLRPSVEAEQSSHLNDTAQDKAEDDVIVLDDDSEPSARDEDEDDESDSATSESESEESYIESEEPPCQEENVESHEMDYRSGLGEKEVVDSAPETDNISESDDSIQILKPSVATASVTPLPVQETHNVSVQSHETICIEDSDEEEEDEQTSEDEEPEEDEEQELEEVLESSVATVLAPPLLAQETCEEKLNASEAVCIGEYEEEASNQDVEPEEVVNAEEDLEYADHGMPTNEAAQILEELNSMVLPQLLKDSQLFENDLTESESRRLDEMFAYVTSHEQDEEEEAVKEQVAEVADEEGEKLEEFEDQPCLESASALLDELHATLLPQLLKDAHDDLTDTQLRRLEKMIAEATEEVEEDIEETAEKEEDVEMADTANEVEGVLAAEEETESSEDKQDKPVLAVVEVEQGTEKPSALCQPMVEEQNEILIQEEANTEEQEKPDEPVDTEKEAYQFDCAFQTVFGGIIKYVYEEERSAINRPSSPVQLPDILMVIKQSNKDKHETAETVLKIANVGPPAYLAITTKDCLLTNNTVASFDTQKTIADRIQRETAQAKFSDRATSADLNFTRKAEKKDAVEVVPIASRASAQINLAIHGTSTTICLNKPASKEDAFFTMPCKPDPITVEAKFKDARATTNVDFVKEGAKMALEHYAGRAKEKVSLTVYAREDVKIKKTTNNRGSCVTTIYIADTIKVPVEAVTCLPLNLSKAVEPENSSVLLKTPKTYKLEPFTVVTAQHEFDRRPQTEASEEIPLRMKNFERVSAFFATANANVSFVAKPQMEYKEHAEQFTPRETVNASFTEKAIQLHRNNESNGANKDFRYFEKISVTENISYVNLNSTHQKKGPREDVMKEWPAINNGIPTSFSTCGLDLDLKKDDKNGYLEDTFIKKHQTAKVEHNEYIIPCSFAKPESNEAVQLRNKSFKPKESVTFECKAPETLQDYDSDQDEYNRYESNPNQWPSGRAHIRLASTTPTNSEKDVMTLDACDDPVVVSPVPRTPDFGSRSSSVHSFRPDESMLEDVNDLEASPLSSPMSQPRFEEEFSASTSYEPPRKRRHEEPKMYKQTEKEKLETDRRKEDSKEERKRKKKEKKEERRREEETRKHKEREAEERRREKERKEKPKEEKELTDKEKIRAAKQISEKKKKQHKIEMELQKTEQNKKDRERQDQQKLKRKEQQIKDEERKKKEEKAKKIKQATPQKVTGQKPNSRKIHTTTLQSDHEFLKAFRPMEVTRKRKRTSSKPAATPLPQKPLPEKVVQKEKTEKAPKKEKKEKDEKKRHRKHREKEVSTSLSDQESRVQPKCEIIQQSSPKKEKSSKAEQTTYTFSTPKRDSQAKEKSDSPQTRISPPLKIKLGVSMKDGKKTYSVKENSADVELSTASMDREDTASVVHLFDEPAKCPPTLPEIPVDEKMEHVPEENEEPQTDHEEQPTNDEPGIEQESEKDQENNMEETPTPVKKFDADVEPPVVDSPEGRQPEETDRYKIYKFLSIKCGKDGKDHPVDEVQMTVEAQVDDNRKATVQASCMPNHSLSAKIRRPAVAASPVDEEMLDMIALSQQIHEDSRAKKANFQPKHDSDDIPPNQAQDDRKRKAIEMENPNKRARCEYEDTYGNDSNTIHMGQPSTSLAQNQCLQQPYEENFTFSQMNEESSIYGTGEQDLMAGIFSAQNMHTMPVTVQQGFDNSRDILSAATAAADILAPDERLPPPADPAVALYVEKLINLPECTQPDLYKNRSVPPMQNTPESVGSVPNHGSLPMQSHDRIEEIPYSNMSTVPGQQFGQQNMTIPPHMQPMNQGGQNWNRTMPRDSPIKRVEENMNCPRMQPHESGSIPIMQMGVNSVLTCPNEMQQHPNRGYVDAMVHQHPGQHPNLPAHQNPQLQSQRLLAQGPPMQISPLIAGPVHDIRMQPRQASYPQGHAPAHVYAMPPSLIVQPVHNPYPAPVVKEPPSRVHSRGTTKAARNKKSAVEAGTSRQMSLVHMQHHPPVHNTQHVVDPMMMQHPRFYNNCMQPSTPMQPNKPIITRSERNAGLENQHDWTNTSFGGNAVSGNLPGFPQVPSRKEPIGQFGSYITQIIPMRHPQTPAPQYLLRQQNYPSTSNQHQDYMMQNATSNLSHPMHRQPYPPEAFNRMQFQQQQQPLEWENPQMLQQHPQQHLQQQQHQPQQSFNYSQDHQMLDQQHIQQQQQQEDRFYRASADSNMHQQEHREEYHRQYPPFAPAPMDPQPEQHWETNADEPQMSTSVQETQRQTPETSENAEVTVECPQPPTADPNAPRWFSDRLADFIRKSMYKTVINDSPNPDKVMVKTLASEITNVAKFNVMKGRHVTIARLRKKVKFLDRRLESLTEPLPGDEDWANVPSRNQALKTVPPRTAAIVRWKASDGEPTKNGDVETLGKKEDANIQKVYQICKKTFTWMKVPRRRKLTCFHVQFFNPCVQGDPEDLGPELLCCHDYFVQNVVITFLDTPYKCIRYGPMKEFNALGSKKQKLSTDPHSDIQAYLHYLDEECCHLDLRSTQDPSTRVLYVLWNRQLSACLNDIFEAREPMNNPHDDGISDQESGPGQGSGPSSSMHGGSFERNTQGHRDAHSYPHHQGYSMRMSRLSTMNKEEVNFLMRRNPELTVVLPTTPFRYCFALESFGTFKLDVLDHFSHFESALRRMRESFSTITSDLKNYVNYSRSTVADTHLSVFSVSRHSWTFCILEMAKQIFTPTKCVDFQKLDKTVYTDAVDKFSSAMSKLFDGKAVRSTLKKLERETKKMPTGLRDKCINSFIFNMLRQTFIPEALLKKLETKPLWDAKARTNVAAIRTVSSCYDISSTCSDLNDIFNKPFTNDTVETLRRHIQTMGGTSRKAQQRNRWQSATKTSFVFEETYNSLKMYKEEARGVLRDLQSTAPINPEMVVLNALHGLPDYVAKMTLSRYIAQRCDILMEITVKSANKAIQRANMSINSMSKGNVSASVQATQLVFDTNLSSYGPKFYNLLDVGEIKTESPEEPPPAKERNPKRPASAATLPSVPAKSIRSEDSLTNPKIPIEPSILLPPSQPSLPSTSSSTVTSVAKKLAYAESNATADSGFASVPSIVLSTSDAPTSTARMAAEDGNKANVPLVIQSDLDFVLPLFNNTPMNSPSADSVESFRTKKMKKQRATISPMRLNNRLRLLAEAADVVEGRSRSSSIDREGSSQPEPKVRKIPPARVLPKKHIVNSVVSDGKHKYSVKVDYFSRSAQIDRKLTVPRTKKLRPEDEPAPIIAHIYNQGIREVKLVLKDDGKPDWPKMKELAAEPPLTPRTPRLPKKSDSRSQSPTERARQHSSGAARKLFRKPLLMTELIPGGDTSKEGSPATSDSETLKRERHAQSDALREQSVASTATISSTESRHLDSDDADSDVEADKLQIVTDDEESGIDEASPELNDYYYENKHQDDLPLDLSMPKVIQPEPVVVHPKNMKVEARFDSPAKPADWEIMNWDMPGSSKSLTSSWENLAMLRISHHPVSAPQDLSAKGPEPPISQLQKLTFKEIPPTPEVPKTKTITPKLKSKKKYATPCRSKDKYIFRKTTRFAEILTEDEPPEIATDLTQHFDNMDSLRSAVDAAEKERKRMFTTVACDTAFRRRETTTRSRRLVAPKIAKRSKSADRWLGRTIYKHYGEFWQLGLARLGQPTVQRVPKNNQFEQVSRCNTPATISPWDDDYQNCFDEEVPQSQKLVFPVHESFKQAERGAIRNPATVWKTNKPDSPDDKDGGKPAGPRFFRSRRTSRK